ncbi:type VI secretion system tube protein TssD [Myxococcus qinghaiensis]|uniref:type VI secretion system tube protein TssD n=1 Tax=Myxococcus qinghaiensis TaxID=2906758 RepID=UPI0020A7F813|nr:type VI secretion system tube protein TssD [Myxococcus qinghaiensis]MCP3169642.1 type VI secretion system tube protein Hcp [Myxococcus qinghaiensis]
MAESVHLFLKANGQDIKGSSTQTSMQREGSIECLTYQQSVITARETGSGMATGRRQYEPLVIRKRIDKSTPLLMKALTENTVVEGTFKFYRPAPAGDGTTEQFYTVSISKARISSIKQINPDVFDPAKANQPTLEEVSFVYHTINWTITDGGATHEDSWNDNR